MDVDFNHNLIAGCKYCELFLNEHQDFNLYYPSSGIVDSDYIVIKYEDNNMIVIRDHVDFITNESYGKILYKCKQIFGNQIKLIQNENNFKHVSFLII